MANTYSLIASNTLGASSSSITFSNIPGIYTDLVLKWSARTDATSFTSDTMIFKFNSNSGNIYSYTDLSGSGSAAASASSVNSQELDLFNAADGPSATANVFSNGELYIPSYAVSQNKPSLSYFTYENNNAANIVRTTANYFRSTTAITSIAITLGTGPNFVSGSSFYLYGIKNS